MSTLVATPAQLEEYLRRLAEEEAAKVEAAAERLQRIAELKAEEKERMRAAKGVPKKRSKQVPAQLGQPTWERGARSPSGFHQENLVDNGGPAVYRSQEKSPLTHPEAAKRTTFFDKAVQDDEARALFRFFVGSMISEGIMRLTGDDSKQLQFVKKEASGRLPFNDRERLEIGARQFVYAKLPEQSQIDMDILVDQLQPRDRNKKRDAFYLDPVTQGRVISASSDDRVAKGAYIGSYRKLAQHVSFLYLEWEMNRFRENHHRKSLVKRDDASLEHFF